MGINIIETYASGMILHFYLEYGNIMSAMHTSGQMDGVSTFSGSSL